MSLVEAYAGEIRMLANNFAPRGWAPCDGRLLSTEEYPVLAALIGTTYGGDGITTFALPDLRGSLPVGADAERAPGSRSEGVDVANGDDARTEPTLAVTYIICLQGVYPDRSQASGQPSTPGIGHHHPGAT